MPPDHLQPDPVRLRLPLLVRPPMLADALADILALTGIITAFLAYWHVLP